MQSKKEFCSECGPAEVRHFLTKANQTVGLIAIVFTKPLQPIVKFLGRTLSREIELVEYFFLQALAFFKIVRLIDKPSVEKDTDRAKCMWQAALERDIKVKEVWAIGKPINVFLAKLPNGKRMVFEGLPRPGGNSGALDWMDNKAIMKKKFRKAGFPVPRGEACFTLGGAKRQFREIRKRGTMVVVKPTLGSRSRHTRINIKTEEQLVEAFKIAKQISPFVSVEEQLSGVVHRVVLISGKVVGVLRRDPPIVFGDGRSTVMELVLKANHDPRRQTLVFHEIPVNNEFKMALQAQNFDSGSVLESGKMIIVGTKIGRSQGGTNTDVTDIVHLENRRLFSDIGSFLQDGLVGIDFIIENISQPWRSQMPCGTIELNSVPFLDLHMYPFEGKVRDLSGILWSEVLSKI